MANPLKILTVLTASQAAKFEQGLDANNQKVTGLADGTQSADAVAYGQLTSLSSSFSSSLDAEVQRATGAESALSGALAAEVTRATGAESALSGALAAEVTRATGAESALSGALAAEVTRATGAESALSGALDAEAQRAVGAESALSGALSAEVTRATGAESALSGALAAEVTRATGAESSLSSSFSSSLAAEAQARADEDLTFLKLDGSRAMSGALNMGGYDITSAKSGSFSGDVTVGGNLQVNGQLTYVNSVNLEVTDKVVTIAKGSANGAAADGAGIEVDGANVSFVYDNAASKWVSDIGLSVAQEASFDAAMKLSGSAFTNITTPVVSGKFDVSDAIHALDIKVGTNSTALSNAYDALRCVVTGTLASGQAIVNLTTVGGLQFATAEIANVALDIMVDADDSGYTNDLVAIKMFVDGSDLKVQIDAPATPSAKYRLIAVNEADGKLAV